MTEDNQEKQESHPNDKELNFRALEQKYQREMMNMKAEYDRKFQEMAQQRQAPVQEEEEEDDEPYVDNRKLDKKLSSFEKRLESKFEERVKIGASQLLQKEKEDNWLRNNPDFYETLQQYSEEFAKRDPELAETILQMPEGFARQKLVYKNIKAMGFGKKDEDIQDKIEKNKQSGSYQPTGIANAAYSSQGDFSRVGQKNAYEEMKKLQARFR